MNDAAIRLGRFGIAFIAGSVAIWILLLILIPHVMLLDYAFHANPGSIEKGLAREGLVSLAGAFLSTRLIGGYR